MCRMLFTLLAVSLGLCNVVRADDKTAPAKEVYLGLKVEAVPAAMYSHLSGVLANGQGVLVDQVMKNSPAEKAGLRSNDVLLNFGDQKLTSPEQLVKLVRHEKPGKEVDVRLIRAGKTMTSKVTLGEMQAPSRQDQSRIYRFTPDEHVREMLKDLEMKTDNGSWQTFDALSLTRTDDTHWRAEIAYRDAAGKKVTRHFTGTREEIRKDILAAKDLPTNERAHLLRALNFQDPVFEFHFPAGWRPDLFDGSDRP